MTMTPSAPWTGNDDRSDFDTRRRRAAQHMAADGSLRDAALAVSVHADRYEWSYQWTWLGLPIIQMPTDVMALAELIWETRPQVVFETGIARGGSVVLSASLLQLLGEGQVIAVDIDIRPHNRHAIESHPLAHRIELIEGSSTDPVIVSQVHRACAGVERVMVILDSNHTHDHVLAELEAYGDLVTPGGALIVADTSIEDIPVQEHRARPWGPGNSPMSALRQWNPAKHGFEVDPFIDAKLLFTASRGGYLRRTGGCT
jgi:cephalosporin hydroxylase